MNEKNKLTGELNHPGDKDADDAFDAVYYGTKSKPESINGTFRFTAIVQFEIDPETAAGLLVESDPIKTVHQWLLSQQPSDNHPYSGNVGELRTKLGLYLVEKKVSQTRELLPTGDTRQIAG